MALCKKLIHTGWIITLTRILCLLGICQGTQGQTCSWTITQPSTGSNTSYIRSVGSTASFVAEVAGEIMTNADRITWKGNDSDLIVLRYTSSDGKFTALSNKRRVNTSNSEGRHTMNINNLTLDDSMAVSVISGGCTVNDVSPKITLEVKYCNLDYFKPTATAVGNTSTCGYNCAQRFNCMDSDETFTATCNENAVWVPSTAPCGAARKFTTAVVILVIGIVFSLALLGLGAFMIRKRGKKKVSLISYILPSICVVLWIISLGLLFGLQDNSAAFVAGCVLAAFGLLGMLIIVIILIVRLVHKRI